MSGTIVYYVVGPVHPRNFELIAREMPDWSFRVTHEPANQWLNAERMAKVPFEKVVLSEDRVPEALWSGDVGAVVFSTTQPRQGPINLLRAALERNVPTIAIEESNQIALNISTIDNYILPVDHLLVASSHEREGMIDAGVPERRVQVTGWPFYTGQVGTTEQARRRTMKQSFGLNPDRPVATLALTALHDPGESPTVRRRQLTLATGGLPPEYQLVVKPHPVETLDVLTPFVTELAPNAQIIEGSVPIDDLLQATDVLLSRGASQVCIEALFHEIPVIILDAGTQTPFYGLVQDVIVEEAGDLARALDRISAERDPMQLYKAFFDVHVPYRPQEAREMTCRRISEIATNGAHETDRASQWFDLALYQAWQLDHGPALDMLSQARRHDGNQPIDALKALIEFRATQEDLDALKGYLGRGFRSQVLRCLWIDQLDRHHQRPIDSDIEWMQDFPSTLNTPWFSQHIRRWVDVLLRSGNAQAAMDLTAKVENYHYTVSNFGDLARKIEVYQGGPSARAHYYLDRKIKKVRPLLASVKRKVMRLV